MSNFERKYSPGYRHMIRIGKIKSTSEKDWLSSLLWGLVAVFSAFCSFIEKLFTTFCIVMQITKGMKFLFLFIWPWIDTISAQVRFKRSATVELISLDCVTFWFQTSNLMRSNIQMLPCHTTVARPVFKRRGTALFQKLSLIWSIELDTGLKRALPFMPRYDRFFVCYPMKANLLKPKWFVVTGIKCCLSLKFYFRWKRREIFWQGFLCWMISVTIFWILEDVQYF